MARKAFEWPIKQLKKVQADVDKVAALTDRPGVKSVTLITGPQNGFLYGLPEEYDEEMTRHAKVMAASGVKLVDPNPLLGATDRPDKLHTSLTEENMSNTVMWYRALVSGTITDRMIADLRSEFVANRREVVFLRTVQGLLHAMKKWSLVLCGIDLNGRLPGHYDTVTGELESDEPDATGRLFAEILGDNGIWAPSTFGALHTGDSATYTHRTGAESRIDFLLLGGVATVDKVGSAVNAAIDNGSPNLDHKAVVLQLCGHLGRVAPRPRLQRLQFDREAMATEEGRQAVANICQAFRQPAWDVHPDEHCRRLEEHLQGEMAKWFPKQPGPGRAS